MPASIYPGFREAVEAMRQAGFIGSRGRAVALTRYSRHRDDSHPTAAAVDGKVIDWMEHVTDAQYRA